MSEAYVCRKCVVDAQQALYASTFPLHRTAAHDEHLVAVASVVAMQASVGNALLQILQNDTWDQPKLDPSEVARLIQLVDEADGEDAKLKVMEAIHSLTRLNPSSHRALTSERSLGVLRELTTQPGALQVSAVNVLANLAAGPCASSLSGKDFARHMMASDAFLRDAGALGVAHLSYSGNVAINDIDPLFEVPDSEESELARQSVICAVGNLLIDKQTRGECINRGGFRRLEKAEVIDRATSTLRDALLSHSGLEGPPPMSPPPTVADALETREAVAREQAPPIEMPTHAAGDVVAGHSVIDVASLTAGNPAKRFTAVEDERSCLTCDQPLGSGDAVQLLALQEDQDIVVHYSCFKCSRDSCSQELTDLYWIYDDQLVCKQHFEESSEFLCGACHTPLKTLLLRAMDKLWHPDHFVCTTCKVSFEDGYYKHESMPYCEQHVAEVMGIKCAKCNETVVGGVKALGRAFHEDCFACFQCGKAFSDQEGFYRHGKDPFCKACVKKKRKEDPLCAKCDESLAKGSSETVVSALNKKWHSDCFVCETCGVNVEKIGFYGRDGLPYCSEHSEEACGACHKPLSGTAFAALGKKFHPACFKCGDCDAPFSSEEGFFEVDGLPYCEPHAIARSTKKNKE